jgi:hypothetical protein
MITAVIFGSENEYKLLFINIEEILEKIRLNSKL